MGRNIFIGAVNRGHYWKENINQEIENSLPNSSFTYAIGNFSSKGQIHYTHDTTTLIGVVGFLKDILGEINLVDFPEGHEFYKVSGNNSLDGRTIGLLREMLGKDSLNLSSRNPEQIF